MQQGYKQTNDTLEKEIIRLIKRNCIFKLEFSWKYNHIFLFSNSSYKYEGLDMFRVSNLYRQSGKGSYFLFLQSFGFPQKALEESSFKITILTEEEFNNLIK